MNSNLRRRTFLQRLAALGILGTSSFEAIRAKAAPPHPQAATLHPHPDGLTILFQGDSITDGGRWREGSDLNHIMGQSYPYLLSSRLTYDYPQRRLKFINRGISGNTVADLLGRWQPDAIDLQPDIISILVGVNDLDRFMQGDKDHAADQFEKRYRGLLSLTKDKLPKARLILCEPFLLPVGRIAASWDRYSSELAVRQNIVRQIAAEFNAEYIHFQRAFNKALNEAPADYWIWDGIHPTPAGHELLAREWLRSKPFS
jgi:lysophospholipase L1-like esterase